MMTVITDVTLKTGAEPEWDTAMRERMDAATEEPGWLGGQLLIPLDGPNRRMIVGTWQTRADWERWHQDDAFTATRERLAELEVEHQDTRWYEVMLVLNQQ